MSQGPEIVVVPRDLYYHEVEYVRGLERAAQATLLFHGALDWGAATKDQWKALTGREMATTRTLCDFIREVLAK